MINKITGDIKSAMLAKNADRLRALRSLKAALVKVLTDNPAVTEITNDEAIKVVQKQFSQRKESRDIYLGQNRYDLSGIETDEINILSEYLPEQISIDDATEILKKIVIETGANSVKDTGLAIKQLGGKIDNKTVGSIVKELLTSSQ